MSTAPSETVPEKNRAAFERTWQSPPGFGRWFSAVNNQPIGMRFMVTSGIFLVLGGILALLIRIQLAVSNNTFIGPELYNQFFTMHGSTMMFLFAVPFLEGLALYMIPLMIGSRDVAFPRLSAFSYWAYLFGGLIFYASFVFGTVPDAGWFAYTPLSGPRYSGMGMDFWLLGLGLVEIAGIAAGVEIAVTILKMRAPGMSLNRLPLFAWTMLVVAIMIIFAFTVLLIATLMLETDRALGTAFFDTERGGSSLLWQHLFWFFGHPEVYIMFLPATGIVAMIVVTFARRPLAAYAYVVVAVIATGFLSFGLWVHHMFATGLPELATAFFTAASLMIAIPSGIQVFAWIATLWGSQPSLKTPLLYVLGFLFLFVVGGLTGVMIAIVPFDLQVHDTFFIVAHFHYVLIGGVLFPIFGGVHYWWPKFTGRMLDERLGQGAFWITFAGFNLTFFPMHIMGFLGMPRRVYTYTDALGIDGYNMTSTVGAFLLAIGFVVYVANLFRSFRKGAPAGNNPWRAGTLEWSMESPPPIFSFRRPPVVPGRAPLWHEADTESAIPPSVQRAVDALDAAPTDWRASLGTDALQAQPEAVHYLPGPSNHPILAALGLLVAATGVLTQNYILSYAAAVFFAGALILWLRPRPSVDKAIRESGVQERSGLTAFPDGPRSLDWWGQVCLVVILATAFSSLFFSYFYLWLFSPEWPQAGLPAPRLDAMTWGAHALLAGGGAAFFIARRKLEQARRGAALVLIAAAAAAGLIFLAWHLFHLGRLGFSWQANAYASIYFGLSWLLDLVLIASLAMLGALLIRLFRAKPDEVPDRLRLQTQLTGLLWYFTVIIAAAVFAVLMHAPYILP